MDHTHNTLIDPRLNPLPLKSIRPAGWLKSQLQIQASGLSGHLDQFWPDIQYSRWFGGDQEGWERAPYWLDGVIPLAYLLEDQGLIKRINGHIDYIVAHQEEDGWLGPREMFTGSDLYPYQLHDVWSQFLIGKALTQYFDITRDQKVFSAIEKNLRCLADRIGSRPLFNWGKFRWFEALLTIFWMYTHRPQAWLYDLAVTIHSQGFNWKEYFKRWPNQSPTPVGKWNYMSHVVNNAMAVKAYALWHRVSGEQNDKDAVYQIIELLEQYHGSLAGIFSGDECLAGKDPTQGTELCAVVEYAFSLETALWILGEPLLADRLEKVIFNALPAAFLPDMWSHQYDQQINQVECSIKPRHWTTNSPESNLFGIEPNYGCCTANFSQGWPKFAAHLWMLADRGLESEGLVAVTYAPNNVEHTIRGNRVLIRVETEYPFRDTIELTVDVNKPMAFPISLRIPEWVDNPSCYINQSQSWETIPGSFLTLDREWCPNDKITLIFPMSAKIREHDRGSISLERGPLVYGLKIEEEFRQVNQDRPFRQPPHADWEVHPRSAWNYGLRVSPESIAQDISIEDKQVGLIPFSPSGAPVVLRVHGRRIPEWQIQDGSAGKLPKSPVPSDRPLELLELIPYGCTNLRIAQFPTLAPDPSEGG